MRQIAEQRDWNIKAEVDPNIGGDGTRVRFYGTPRDFRMMADIFTTMADTVDDPDHPAAQCGWSLVFNPKDLPQFQIKNASFLSLSCSPSK